MAKNYCAIKTCNAPARAEWCTKHRTLGERNRRHAKRRNERIKQAVHLAWKSGMSHRAIATQMGCSRAAISNYLGSEYAAKVVEELEAAAEAELVFHGTWVFDPVRRIMVAA